MSVCNLFLKGTPEKNLRLSPGRGIDVELGNPTGASFTRAENLVNLGKQRRPFSVPLHGERRHEGTALLLAVFRFVQAPIATEYCVLI